MEVSVCRQRKSVKQLSEMFDIMADAGIKANDI